MIDPQSSSTSGYHLFLEPEGEVARELSEIIRTLAARSGGPVFPPHVTLAGPVPEGEDEVIAIARSLAASEKPFTLTLGELSGEPSFFRAFYAHVPTHPVLLRLRERAGGAEPYVPHLSLFYGLIDGMVRAQMSELAHGVPGMTFPVSGIAVYMTAGPADTWKKLADMPFPA